MKDQYGRIIDYMRISITDRCNLRCRYCMPEGVELVPMKNILSYEEIEMVCQAAAKAGIRKFKITGGEPLVRLGCPELIGKIKKIPGVEQVTMTTNGVLLSKYLPELLKNGLDAVNISLDTLDRERYQVITGRDELFRVLESVDQAVDAGIPVKINSVLQKGMNEDEFLALARLTLEKKLDVRFIEMMPIGLGKKFETIYNEDILEELKKQYPDIQEDRQIHGNGPAVYVKLPGGQGSVGFISALHGKFCQYCNRIRMTAQGCLKPCLCYGKGVELKDIFDRHEKSQRCGITMADQETLEYLYQAITEAIQLKPKSHRFENLSEITDQYIEYINQMEKMNLEITSEFLIMASTLLYIKSKNLLPTEVEDEKELTEEELLQRIIEYKKYKEISKKIKEFYEQNNKRFFKLQENIKLPKQKLEVEYHEETIPKLYMEIIEKNKNRLNQNAKNIEKIAITDSYTVGSKVKEMFKELLKKPKFVFNKMYKISEHNKQEVVTAFTGLLELSRRSKVETTQEEIFGDITVEKAKRA